MMRSTTLQTPRPALEIPLMKAMSLATRSQHANLNRLILSNLHLALPPHTSSPEAYAQGLLAFASIYFAFESAWQILSDYEPANELPLETAVVLSSLIHLHIPTLPRSERLLKDLSLLLATPEFEIGSSIRHPSSKSGKAFVEHIKDIARNKPHALIAYGYVLYMALFNGGRWIREQLTTARDISWVLANSDLAAVMDSELEGTTAGLSFWHFDSKEDGDDVKNDFKARLEDVGSMLNAEQKDDIIDEARTIFERCTEMVLELAKPESTEPQNVQRSDMARSTAIQDLLGYLVPVILMQLIMVLLKKISGARIRSPLPFRKLDRRDD